MASEILSAATGVTPSSDVVVISPLTVGLKGTVDGAAEVVIELKDDAAAYHPVDQLRSSSRDTLLIQAPGTYRFRRTAASTICGVYSA